MPYGYQQTLTAELADKFKVLDYDAVADTAICVAEAATGTRYRVAVTGITDRSDPVATVEAAIVSVVSPWGTCAEIGIGGLVHDTYVRDKLMPEWTTSRADLTAVTLAIGKCLGAQVVVDGMVIEP